MSTYAYPRIAVPERREAVESPRPIARRRWNPWGDYIRWASGKSNYLAKKIADLVYSATAFTAPVTVYFALWTTGNALTAASTGSTAGETAYTSYARVAVTNNATQFPAATGSTTAAKSNANAVTFAQNTGTSSTIVSGATLDASTTGNILHWGDIASTVINANDTPQINAAGFALTES